MRKRLEFWPGRLLLEVASALKFDDLVCIPLLVEYIAWYLIYTCIFGVLLIRMINRGSYDNYSREKKKKSDHVVRYELYFSWKWNIPDMLLQHALLFHFSAENEIMPIHVGLMQLSWILTMWFEWLSLIQLLSQLEFDLNHVQVNCFNAMVNMTDAGKADRYLIRDKNWIVEPNRRCSLHPQQTCNTWKFEQCTEVRHKTYSAFSKKGNRWWCTCVQRFHVMLSSHS